MFVAPANYTNGENWSRLLTWLRQKGVRKIYDVSLGADICTWAHIRYIQKEKPRTIITQPCPAIVSYVLIHNHALLPFLSPVHSPMLCTAIYMKRYEGINDKIAALSPCIAKTHEFDATGYVEYNVTLKRLYEYIEKHRIALPTQETGFDHAESALGILYPMPGGLKENVELYIGKDLRIDKSEGTDNVYKALEAFSVQRKEYLPAIFDVLNCLEGCNLGTACIHERDMFEVNTIMDMARREVIGGREKEDFDALFEGYDEALNLSDFIRRYTPMTTKSHTVTNEQIQRAFYELGKETDIDQKFDCCACGSDTCYGMARKIALGLNIAQNCIKKVHADVSKERNAVMDLSSTNLTNIKNIMADITEIKQLSDGITQSVTGVNTAIEQYSSMAMEIDRIARQINIISLNASVEAARAGEHGKTFAVIAGEIRNLANSSKNTVSETEQITEQATDSIKGINVTIERISTEVEKAFQNITDISERTREALKGDGLLP
ncbi:MAG: methyl-accepting chemotaxis protein [Chitinispirillales bacterium]|nr:methyl-accepting chemotaxis protein [Chitinispirillales bacterium]